MHVEKRRKLLYEKPFMKFHIGCIHQLKNQIFIPDIVPDKFLIKILTCWESI